MSRAQTSRILPWMLRVLSSKRALVALFVLALGLVPLGRAQSVTYIQSSIPKWGIFSNWNPTALPNPILWFNNPDPRSGLTVTVANKSQATSPTFNISIQQGTDSLDPSLNNGWSNIACTRLNNGTFTFKTNYPAFGVFSGEALSGVDQNIYNCPATGAARYRILLTSGTTAGPIDITGLLNSGSTWQTGTLEATGNPCSDPRNPTSSVAINIAAAGTSGLVNLSGTQIIYVCGFTVTAGAGTNPSFQLEYGSTNGTCVGGTTTLTGAMATGVTVSTTVPGPIFTYSVPLKTAAGNALCAVAGGTTPNFQGVLTFIQQ